jgi:hypothetical protein
MKNDQALVQAAQACRLAVFGFLGFARLQNIF